LKEEIKNKNNLLKTQKLRRNKKTVFKQDFQAGAILSTEDMMKRGKPFQAFMMILTREYNIPD